MTDSKRFAHLLGPYVNRSTDDFTTLPRLMHIDPSTLERWTEGAETPADPATLTRLFDALSIDDASTRVALAEACCFAVQAGPGGDMIVANVTDATNVAVGKQITQINISADAASIARLVAEGRAAQASGQGGRLMWGVGALPLHYVPRQAEMERLRDALSGRSGESGVALTALEGMGGVGKSTLAMAMAADPACAETYPDGVLWGRLGPEAADESAADAVLLGWGAALGLAEIVSKLPTPETKADFLAQQIRDRQFLLVLDDL